MEHYMKGRPVMARDNDKMPEVVFVGPARRRAKFVYVLFRILGKHADGTPKECVRVRDDETVDVREGAEFMTAYIPAQMLEGA